MAKITQNIQWQSPFNLRKDALRSVDMQSKIVFEVDTQHLIESPATPPPTLTQTSAGVYLQSLLNIHCC